MGKDWHGINDLYYSKTPPKPPPKPVKVEEEQKKKDDGPEVRLSEGKFIAVGKGFQFNEKCKVRVKVEYLKKTTQKKVTFKLFVVYNKVEEDLKCQADGFEDKGYAEAEVRLFYGDKYSKDLQKNPGATCFYKFKASHPKGEKVLESEQLEMPVKQKLKVDFVEVTDIHFHHNCALPCLDDKGDMISALVNTFYYSKEHPDRELVIEGHADASGNNQYNLQISKRRAESVKALLQNDEALWKGVVDSNKTDHTIETEDYQQTLKSLAAMYNWPCDPGNVDNKHGLKTDGAVKNFQKEYNKQFPNKTQLVVDGKMGPKTWQALFHVFRKLTEDGLKASKLVPAPVLPYGYPAGKGIYPCAESSPVSDAVKSKEQRRVELVFYKKGECTPVIQPVAGRKVDKKKDPVTEKEWEKKDVTKLEYDMYDMVELVEIVTQDKEKWVKGAAMDTTEIAEKVERADKDGANYKQYINMSKDIEGAGKRHPEYSRQIRFKAKIKQTNNKSDKLKDVLVKFSFKRTDGPNRTNPGGTDPDVWKVAQETVTGDLAEGFSRANGDKTITVKTDNKGWTEAVLFFVSAYGGDQFEINASLAPGTPGGVKAKTLATKAKYVVWRKFWYQLTYADGFNPPKPTKARDAYKEVFAEMIESSEKKFKKDDLLADIRGRTFYKEYMLKQAGANADVATIGSNNKNEFTKKAIYDKDTPLAHPFKANLIVCNYQCDSKGPSAEGVFELKSNGASLTMTENADGGSIICKPALKPGAKLVVKGEWSRTQTPWTKAGDITDGAIEIDSARASTLTVKVDLSKGATGTPPVPTNAHPLYVKLQLETGKDYLGESFGKGQILCVYRPDAQAGKQGSEADYNDTVAHELGHMWNQTPTPGRQPSPMKNHPLQYVGHGGTGSHCRFSVALDILSLKPAVSVANNVEPETTITKAAAVATATHEVGSTADFIKDYKVKVNGVNRVIKKVKDATHLEFTTSFTAAVDDKVKQYIDWNDANKEFPMPYNGKCLMYHSFSEDCSHKFCKTCKPYLQLQDMSAL